MTETPIAERLDDLAERARAEVRNPEFRALFADMIDVLREIDARRPATVPGTGITPAELEQAIGGTAFLGNLGRLLETIDRARHEDVERVLHHLFAARPPAGPPAP